MQQKNISYGYEYFYLEIKTLWIASNCIGMSKEKKQTEMITFLFTWKKRCKKGMADNKKNYYWEKMAIFCIDWIY